MADLANLSLRDQLRVDRLPRRLAQMTAGLMGFGLSLAMLLQSGLGGAPWDVLHSALAQQIGGTVGLMSISVSFVLLLAWIPLREQPGIGTFANAVLVGLSLDLGLLIVPAVDQLLPRLVLMLAAVAVNGISAALYIGAQLGPGARDGLMTGLSRVLRRRVGPIRVLLEVTVLLVGWMLGGPVGVGTVVYALGLGPVIQLFLPRVTIEVRSLGGVSSDPSRPAPPRARTARSRPRPRR